MIWSHDQKVSVKNVSLQDHFPASELKLSTYEHVHFPYRQSIGGASGSPSLFTRQAREGN